MSLDAEILADFIYLLDEHGVSCVWNGTSFTGLSSPIRNEQQIEVGGFVEGPDLTVRAPNTAFTGATPAFGDKMTVDGDEYRVFKTRSHPRSPLLTFELMTKDE